MYIHPAPLAETVNSLRSGNQALSPYLEQVTKRHAEVEPHVHAFLSEPGRALRLQQSAQRLAARYPNAVERPPLYGCLVGVKDIFHVTGFVTRAGSNLPPEEFAGSEALAVTRLRAAGALVTGKTVTTEFAYFEPGPTRNPHNLMHTPGGSSSGSAAAVASGLSPLALGTQTIGSVIRPAAFCGIFGFKPTFDRIPTAGLVYFSRSVDHVGLFSQDLDGMSLVASVLCADWRGVPTLRDLPVLGVPAGPYLEQAESEGMDGFERQTRRLAQAGYDVRSIPILDDIEQLNRLHWRLAFGEFAREHALLFPKYAERYRPRTREIIEFGMSVPDDKLDELRRNCRRLRNQLEETMNEAGVDLWVCPAAPGPAPAGIEATGDPSMNLPWTHAGMPVLAVPAGRAESGLPLGLQLVGRFGEDEALLAWASSLVNTLAEPMQE